MNRKRCTAAGRLALLVVLLGTTAWAGAAEKTFKIEGHGLYLAGVSFFGAVPVESGADSLELHFGDLERIDWEPGALPVIDAQVLLANSSGRRIPSVDVRVSIYLGTTTLNALTTGEDLVPGHRYVRESLFFERDYTVKDLDQARLGRIAVTDIHLTDAIEDQMRQKRWPAYVRVEAKAVDKPEWLEVPAPSVSGLLKVLPRSVLPAAATESPSSP